MVLWKRYLDGALGPAPPEAPVILLGHANLDPADGEGLRAAIRDLLDHPRLQDVAPASIGGAEAAELQGGVNAHHRGDPARDTADWSDDVGPGNLRVGYVLPDRRLQVLDAGVFWPEAGDPLRRLIEVEDASRHRLVWIDVAAPD